MSAAQEKEKRQEKRTRESSVSKKHKAEDIGDRRPFITQEKPLKSSASGLKERGRIHKERTPVDKPQKRRTAAYGDGKGDKITTDRDRRSSRDRQQVGAAKPRPPHSIAKDSRIDDIYVKDLLEKKGIRKSGAERSAKEKPTQKPTKGILETETASRKEDGRKDKVRRERTRTRTLSPTEIKQLVPSRAACDMAAGDGGPGVHNGGEARKAPEEAPDDQSDQEYEDDFEEYDSNFEDDSSSESAPQEPPTGHPETPPETVQDQWKTTVRKQELEAIRKSIEKENWELIERRQQATRPPENDSDKENKSTNESTQLIDFSSASRRLKKTKKAAASRKRGEELLSMITLDTISYCILEVPAIPYEDFMRAFGRSNTKQAHVQTNEDDLDEEIQTDEVPMSNKWTQNPPEYLGGRGQTGSRAPYILSKEERLGVGGDVPTEDEMGIRASTNALLWSFLSRASQLVLTALEKKSGNFLSLENMPNHSKAMAFGAGFVRLDVSDVPFLKGRSVTQLCSLSKSAGRLLSVHVNKEKSFQKCMICVWSLRELSKPLKVLMASNRVVSCCFGLNQGNLVFGGLSDGSICLWDLREPSAYHTRVTASPEWTLQSATYTTAACMGGSTHCSPVVAIRLLSNVDAAFGFADFTPMQIASLDSDGTIIIWTVVQLEKPQRSAPSDDLGLAHWGRVKLVKTSAFSVFAALRDEIPGLYITCNDLLVNEPEDDGFYVANSLGSVQHCSAYGAPMKPKFYVPSKQDAIIEATCLELCPFDGNYFLVGCGDGTIRLHSRHHENPLICLNPNSSGEGKAAGVVSLAWMRMKPCVFFALDALSRINIWDLGVSDMYPEVSLVLTEKRITCMKLVAVADPRQVPFMVIGTEGGSIEVHKLKREFGCRTASDVQNEMKMFLKYVSIL